MKPLGAGPLVSIAGLESGPRVLCGHANGKVSTLTLPDFTFKFDFQALDRHKACLGSTSWSWSPVCRSTCYELRGEHLVRWPRWNILLGLAGRLFAALAAHRLSPPVYKFGAFGESTELRMPRLILT